MKRAIGFACSLVAYLPISWWLQPPFYAGIALAFMFCVVIQTWINTSWRG